MWLRQRFQDRMGKDLILLTVTFDPVRDQPEVLRNYAKTWKANRKISASSPAPPPMSSAYVTGSE